MSELNNLKFNFGSKKNRKRVARGNGSGFGGTAGRGHKGQKSRSGASIRTGFEGGQMPLYRRMPKRKGFNNLFRIEYRVINIGQLDKFEDGALVDKLSLYNNNLISNIKQKVKLCSVGDISKKLTIKIEKASKVAVDKIVKVGGSVEVLE